jgi:hypothetical protein
VAGDGGWCGGAERGTDELSFGSDRLEKSTTHLATAERGLGLKKFWGAEKKSPQIADFVIPSASWKAALNLYPKMSKR